MIDSDLNREKFDTFCKEFAGDSLKAHVQVGPWDHENGYLSLCEVWSNSEGKTDRRFGPAITHSDPDSGTVFWQEWWRNGNRHREDGPAVLITDPGTGEILDKRFYHDGEQIFPALGNAPDRNL